MKKTIRLLLAGTEARVAQFKDWAANDQIEEYLDYVWNMALLFGFSLGVICGLLISIAFAAAKTPPMISLLVSVILVMFCSFGFAHDVAGPGRRNALEARFQQRWGKRQ